MSLPANSKLEEFVKRQDVFQKLCDKIYSKLDKDKTGNVPVFKLTLAMPILFDKFQAKLFDKIDVTIGKPSYKQVITALRESDANNDRKITRQEFEDVGLRMLRIATGNFGQSFKAQYSSSILLGIIAMQVVTHVAVVNTAVMVQKGLSWVPTFGG
eukprot:CAMPEP_0202914944 /NCGR_PEP_ID=MMETSP1392-20130828/64466_1 /ASSEMBLY_ACC=CAM_ASM_000868 /TAXON_ID=225041 /ORGANISM="Chlamydomonas chlamydogama, Strain SAG 11-48b" /LENGTH=155 /DNA_ID=CAMNT_0049606793 /DNA_START=70 /DNA_END=534 /DNA_ORIENTATION=+